MDLLVLYSFPVRRVVATMRPVRFWSYMLRSVCVFCGSSVGNREEYRTAAAKLGSLLAKTNIQLVYGGAKIGLMGAIADACLASGGRAIGVMPQFLVDKEIAHNGLTELRIVTSMHERKAMMADLSDAFIALPGGLGTLEEYFESATWTQLGLQRKACGLLNVAGYYDGILAQGDRAMHDGFLKPQFRELLFAHHQPGALLELLERSLPAITPKWRTQPAIR